MKDFVTHIVQYGWRYPAGESAPDRVVMNCASYSHGIMNTITYEPLAEDDFDVLARFAKVFEQTYTRFLDLQKAEAQAREAQIEAALERVRACTMAMHQSEELQEVIRVVFEQLESLNLDIDASNINVHLKDSKDHYMWTAATSQRYDRRVHLPYFNHPFFTRYETALHNGEALLTDTMTFEEKNSFFVHFYTHAEFTVPKKRKAYIAAAKGIARSTVLSKDTSLTIWNYKVVPYTPDENGIIKRFAQVFEQTYTRFLDLQKAEAQAREAQIEAALERVRAKAMAMHSSEDLATTVSVVFQELRTLHITPMRCGVGLIDGETQVVELLTTSATKEDHALELVGTVKLKGHYVLESVFEYWKVQKEYHPVLKGNSLKKYYELVRPHIDIPDWQSINIQYGYFFYFPEGALYTWAEKEFVEEELRIFRKFTSVLGLTYRRYLDLKEAETRAREAEQQASVDRVRAEIATMRTADDLQRITPAHLA
ncbi:hypothetical protein IIC38_05650 [candidate division KSB1 bacterium]|nr:hypothetical protein [candidate division KSB1 bacterium]